MSVVGVVGCARNAPTLPSIESRTAQVNRNSPEFRLSCSQLTGALKENKIQITQIESRMDEERVRNQAVMLLFGAPGVIATKQFDNEKAQLDILQSKRDVLILAATEKKCAAN
jgi:hypothetical protein